MQTTYEGRAFGNERVPADGVTFIDCTFENTVLTYTGGEPFVFNRPSPGWYLEVSGPAENTLLMLAGLYRFGLASTVEAIFDSIRTGGDMAN